MKYRFLLLALVLPLFAQADPLNNGALAVLAYVALFLAGLALLAPLLTVWSYLRPRSRVLYVLQLLLLALGLWFGGMLHYAFHGEEFPLLGRFNPLWEVSVPISVWLNSVMLARHARHDKALLVWGVGAVLALYHLVQVGPYTVLTAAHWRLGSQVLSLIGYQLAMMALLVGSWWVVLRQLGRPAVFWQPWWRAPLVFAGIELVYRVLDLTMNNLFTSMLVLALGTWPLLLFFLNWIGGVVALRLIRPAERSASELEEV